MSGQVNKFATFDEIMILAERTYREAFGKKPELACCAPGRVNLIGDHVDYNDGFVLPMALPMVTLVVGGHRPDDDDAHIITCCTDADGLKSIKFSLKDLKPGKPKWANYVKGVIHCFAERANGGGAMVGGFNAVIASNVPVGAGLSSSAALEVATLTFLEHLTGHKVESSSDRALICQAAEHKFAGMPCGIMDQMVSVAGQDNNFVLIDCRSMECFQIPFEKCIEKDVVVLICNSGVSHELSSSEYPKRRQQCSEALRIMGVKSYRDVTMADLAGFNHKAKETLKTNETTADDIGVLEKRARHVLKEIQRTQDAAKALRDGRVVDVGSMLFESHASLRDDFEVSCPEVDSLIRIACNNRGVLGARMTGGGFGGCIVALVYRPNVDNIITQMRDNFATEFGPKAAERLEFYMCKPSAGARRVQQQD